MHESVIRLLDYARRKTKGASTVIADFQALQVLLQTSSATMTNWKSRGISKDGAIKAERELGVSANWLLTGEGDEDATHTARHKALVGKAEAVTEALPFLPGFKALSIPLMAQAGAMGAGEEQLPDDVVVGRLTVSPQWVTKTLKPLTDIKKLRFIHGYGDSMEPTFRDGDILLVDSGVEEPKIDGVYVLEANDRIYIKRVTQRFDGGHDVTSDNPTVKTIGALDGSRPVRVLGRVVYCWNGKKL